ncbi:MULTISPECIES: hypothetical protein [unclassified Nocardioides]|uniref:hypothetical protein n=1 Tax=unclassified Nocardioides TaxID=2615069 RepID=UPI000703630D|nr:MULTISPECIES: hypothetical protein [unclassified Nocardioides]KQQ41494.1 hypothetical protein ASF50_10870 [Nocardioides sp. Leaf307]
MSPDVPDRPAPRSPRRPAPGRPTPGWPAGLPREVPRDLGGVLGVLGGAAMLPVRVGVAATQTTLQLGRLAAPDGPVRRPGGYADLVLRVIGEHGYAQQLVELLTDEDGPMRLARTVNELMEPGRPVARLLERDGLLDRLLADEGPLARLTAADGGLERLLGPEGPVERLLAPDGALERLLAEGGALDQLIAHEGVLDRLLQTGGALDRLTAADGVLDQVLRPGGLADRMLTEDGFVEKLIADGGTLDQLVALGATLEGIQPRLVELARIVPALAESADALGRAVGPLGDLAGRLPGRRKPMPLAP